MMMTLLFLREDAGHFSKGSEGEESAAERAPERGEVGETRDRRGEGREM